MEEFNYFWLGVDTFGRQDIRNLLGQWDLLELQLVFSRWRVGRRLLRRCPWTALHCWYFGQFDKYRSRSKHRWTTTHSNTISGRSGRCNKNKQTCQVVKLILLRKLKIKTFNKQTGQVVPPDGDCSSSTGRSDEASLGVGCSGVKC